MIVSMQCRYFPLFFLLLWCSVAIAMEPQKTVIEDPAEAQLLLGRHVFSDHAHFKLESYWQETRFGDAIITNWGDDVYIITGRHEYRSQDPCTKYPNIGGFVQLSGTITSITHNAFQIRGIISGAYDWDETHYQEEGVFTFSRKGHPGYWSMLNIPSPSNAEDYFGSVDIYVTPDLDKIFNRDKALERIKKKCAALKE